MFQKNSHGRNVVVKEGKLLKRLLVVFLCAVIISALGFGIVMFIKSRTNSGVSLISLRAKWRDGDYGGAYDISGQLLYDRPFNHTALLFRGYSSFYLAAAENDTVQAQGLIDEAIASLRQALLFEKDGGKNLPRIEYMLGKSYFYKDFLSAYHYYADLSVKYPQSALSHGYKADDIPEILGLNYAALGMTLESISSFSEALLVRQSDLLLLSIAEQYHAAGQNQAAEQYLYRISQECKDEKITLKSRYLLGDIYLEGELLENAEKEFRSIIDEYDGSEHAADAYYGLGLVFEKQNEMAKARSEWRKALRIQSNHAGALAALKKSSER